MKKIVIFSLSLALVFSLGVSVVMADETGDALSDVEVDQMVTAEDLDISDPGVLPDSLWFGLKRMWENIQLGLTFDPIKKVEKQMEQANKRLMEAKKLAEKVGSDEIVEKAMEQYELKSEAIKTRLEAFSDKGSEKLDKLLDKFADYQIKHQKVLEKVENLRPEIKNKVESVRERSMARFGDVLDKVDREEIEKRLNRVMGQIQGSDLKNLKNLDILKSLEEAVPEEARAAIIRAQGNVLKRLSAGLQDIDASQQGQRIKNYLDNFKADEVHKIDIINQLETAGTVSRRVLNEVIGTKTQLVEQIKERVRQAEADMSEVGTIEAKRLRNRIENSESVKPFIDVRTIQKIEDRIQSGVTTQRFEDPKVCPLNWAPVCGVDGKTYANECSAGDIEIKNQGECVQSGTTNTRTRAGQN